MTGVQTCALPISPFMRKAPGRPKKKRKEKRGLMRTNNLTKLARGASQCIVVIVVIQITISEAAKISDAYM